MPKTPSHKLFDLIQSLSGAEKRYFKLFVKRGKSDKHNKYIRLFDAIDAQKQYDDEALRQLVYHGKPIQSRKYSELKSYLYELVLKSLQGYDEQSSIDFKLKNILLNVRVLFKRAHYSEALEQVQKGKKLAYTYNQFPVVLNLMAWEKRIAHTRDDIAMLDERLEEIEKEEGRCLIQIEYVNQYRNLYYRMLVIMRKYSLLRSEEKINMLKGLLDQPLMEITEESLCFTAKVLKLRIQSVYAFSALNHVDFHQKSNELLQLLESQPHFFREDLSDYLAALSNLTLSCGLLGKYTEVEELLGKYRTLSPKTIHDELKIHTEYYSKKFSLWIFTGEFDKAFDAIYEREKVLQRVDHSYYERDRFYFQYFYIYFGIGDYDQALEYLNRWLNLPKSIERQDLQSLARILNLIIHFELGNTLLLEYLLRSTYRYLRSRNRIYEFEKRVLNFIRESGKLNTKKEMKIGFIKLKTDFEKLAEIPSEKIMFQYFDFIAWLESKIKGKPFAEIVKTNYLRQHQQKTKNPIN